MTRFKLDEYKDKPIPMASAQDRILAPNGGHYPVVQSRFIAAAYNFRFDPHSLPSLLYMRGTLTPVTRQLRMSHASGRLIDSRVLCVLFQRTCWAALHIGTPMPDGSIRYPTWLEIAKDVDEDGDCYDPVTDQVTKQFRRSVERLQTYGKAFELEKRPVEDDATRGKNFHEDGQPIAFGERKFYSVAAIKSWRLDFLLSLNVVDSAQLHNFVVKCNQRELAKRQRYYKDNPEIEQGLRHKMNVPQLREASEQVLRNISYAKSMMYQMALELSLYGVKASDKAKRYSKAVSGYLDELENQRYVNPDGPGNPLAA